jgi:hypothetical protein
MAIEKFCTRCGKKFIATGREVICPSCKAAAEEESKRAAVMRAKRASWNGESVPVRISGRASTLIRVFAKHNNMSFAEGLDALLQASDFFRSAGRSWEDVKPYRSHRRDRATATATSKASTSTTTSTTETAQEVKQVAKVANKNTTSKTVKTSTAGKAGKKVSASKK